VTAARWAQRDILERHPAAPLRIYAVWFNMYPGDSRAKWPAEALTDSRVTHYWDEQRVVGEHYLRQLGTFVTRRANGTMPPVADALWDAAFVHGPGDQWSEPVPLPRIWGYPIMVTHDGLLDALNQIIK
jgi:hypothetical protein